jgi:toxin ParE1/3/4
LAQSDLRHVKAYIKQHDPRPARETTRKIKQASRRLVDFPASGRPGRWPNTRELAVPGAPYILPYCVKDNELWILAVLHAAKTWPDSE